MALPLMAKDGEELKSLLMKVKEESENPDLKLNIQKTKIMASTPITSLQTNEKTMEIVTDFIFWGAPKLLQMVTAVMKLRHLLLGRKAMTNLDSVLKSKTIFPTKIRIVKAHVWMWGLDYEEGWTLKNWHFLIVELEKTLESSLDCKEIKPVHPKGNQSWIVFGELMLNLKLQYFGHLMPRANSSEKTVMMEKVEGRRKGDDGEWDGWMASPNRWTRDWASSGSWWWTGKSWVLQPMGAQRVGHNEELNKNKVIYCLWSS